MTTNYTQKLTGKDLEQYIKARFSKPEDDAPEPEPEDQTITMTESEALSQYDDMLDDCYPMAEICGYQYQPSRALRELDPIAYRVGFSDYCSSLSEDGYEIDYD